jgi:signal peptidase I
VSGPVGAILGAAAVLTATSLVAATLVRRRFTAVWIRGGSMAPALCDGDVVLARRRGGHHGCRSPRRGDVVILHRPSGVAIPAESVEVADPGGERPRDPAGRWLVKRVAAVAGDRLPPGVPFAGTPGDGTVPAGMVVVLGDCEGFDSRLFGPVAVGSIHATVIRKLRPRMAAGDARRQRWDVDVTGAGRPHG